MELLLEIAKELRQLRDDIPFLLEEVLQENASVIEGFNIAQLDQGKRADGAQLRDYSPVSVSQYGYEPGPIKLLKTGAFRSGIELKTSATEFSLIGTDPKTAKLEAEHGAEIIGIAEEYKQVIVEEIVRPGLQNKIRTRLERL